jgi:hypothetical protein
VKALHRLAIVGLTVTSLVTPAQAALAAPVAPAVPGDRCFAGTVCLFDGPDATGPFVYYTVGDADLSSPPGALFNDRAESWVNRTSRRFCWYPAANYGPGGHGMNPLGTYVQNLLPAERNTASSIRASSVGC